MSRTAEDWSIARSRALEIRAKIHEALDLIDRFPGGFPEADSILYDVSGGLGPTVARLNELVGVTSPRWAVEDE